ncbi:MAG TPA: SpoIIE family protein phosphatase [Candidatus Acidoferrales bacterium]|nr:SpoIIE family protein phosphatase [Candidatus Acidoferrales bacterium]
MFGNGSSGVRSFWRGLTWLDRVALAVAVLYTLTLLLGSFRKEVPGAGLIGFLFFLALVYLLFRLLGWVRIRLLWSLRNRLIVAYVLIAVVPVLLLAAMAALSAYILYWQLGAYLVYDDFQKRIEKVAATADVVGASLATEAALSSERPLSIAPATRMAALAARTSEDLPGLHMELGTGQEFLGQPVLPGSHFAGLVQAGGQLWLRAVKVRSTLAGPIVVSASLPVSPDLMDSLVPEVGPIQVAITRLATPEDPRGTVFSIGERQFVRVGQVATRGRALPPPANWFDYEVSGVSKLEATLSDAAGKTTTVPVLAFFSTRPSRLNRRLFSSLGEIGGATVTVLIAIGVVFLVIEVAALVTGVVLTRTITQAVADLYRATHYIQAGDFTHRVRVERQDQLGVLAESFNTMTSSISSLIEEQRKRQRLENELSIAREVQEQLFPQQVPSLPGIQLEAICRAARMVSGDYYDFIRLGPTRLGIAIADISGKGISAALLMASLQAALRSQALFDGASGQNTAELVARLNRHLYHNTSEDRYATLFYAVYETSTRTLRYTNAGHLPPLYIVGEEANKLQFGGTVVGLFDDCLYEEGTIQAEPGSLLVAYSDGLIEPENVYGEEFGTRRLLEVTLRHRGETPRAIANALMVAAEEWAGSPEQADDMTVIVARLE